MDPETPQERVETEGPYERARPTTPQAHVDPVTGHFKLSEETEKVSVMDGGLGIFGLGLFLFGVANLYVGAGDWGVTWIVFAFSLLSMGLAFSEYHGRRVIALGMAVALLLMEVWAAAVQARWWQQVGLVIFAVCYFTLWAEYRFPVFGRVGEAEVPRGTGSLRGLLRRQRA